MLKLILIIVITILSIVFIVYLLDKAKEIKLDNDKIYKDELKKS